MTYKKNNQVNQKNQENPGSRQLARKLLLTQPSGECQWNYIEPFGRGFESRRFHFMGA